ncbi:aldehyde dehydrogenase family protein [Paenibacillus aurantius]|uniref:3-sulfolactaldehyde dehydrogenase n=1 Tax=Paenibacillus aurantius TaxID=2918900 RepID=A0AA96L8Y0_9BACL|nr:aldehyde dehydrogenase family protein [Paenibacillus aurantius]WNQ08928.1 aldehyde dehydrogenase family protein [Paenibacillus aurantius]
MKRALNYVAGEWRESESGEWAAAYNPARPSEQVGEVTQSTREEVSRAVDAAEAAFAAWRGLPGMKRGKFLAAAARILEDRADAVAETMTREMGKTFAEARGEVLRGAAILHYYAGEGERSNGEHIPPADGKSLLYTRRIPLGAVGLITPWNFPVAIPVWKLAPALVYGNTVVLKPAGNSSVTACLLVEALEEAGLPPGVVNLVHGSGRLTGDALLEHPKLAAISFTGSNAVGRKIAEKASHRGLKYQLEMGGKNAVIVMEDADLDQAADMVVSGSMKSTGQKCTATSKVIVMSAVAEVFIERLTERLRSIRMGDGMEPETYYGPLSSRQAQQSVLSHIHQGQEEGARLLTGGKAPDAEGYHVEPTLFAGVTPSMSLAREEIFGPVLAVMEADSLDEAIGMANDTDFGLSAAIFTQSLSNALTFVSRIEAGMIKVNAETAGVEYQAPFGGLKQSSSHSREQGRAAMEFFTHTQTISLSL